MPSIFTSNNNSNNNKDEQQRLLGNTTTGSGTDGRTTSNTTTTTTAASHHHKDDKNDSNMNSLRNKMGRSASISALGGTQSFGTFHIKSLSDGIPILGTQTTSSSSTTTSNQIQRSRSVSMDYGTDGVFGTSNADLTPTQMGRQELYIEVPFTAVFGLQRKERSISQAFANYAAELDIAHRTEYPILNEEEKKSKLSRASMIILEELEFEANVVTIPLVVAIIIAAASQFLVGYNTGVMNAPAKYVFPSHTTFQWSIAVASFAVGGPFGASTAGRFADVRGRRGALLIAAYTFLVGGILQTCAIDMLSIIIARFIIGFASGFSSVLVPIYLGEMAPPTLRGMLGTVTQFALVVGILVANLLAFPFAKEGNSWRILFAVTPIISIAQIIMAPFLLESPRWLLGRDPKSLKARYIVKRLRGLRYDHEVESEVRFFLMGGDAQNSSSDSDMNSDIAAGTTGRTSSSQMSILNEMWKQNKIRNLLLASLTLQVAQQFCGINAVFYYSTSFFEGVIENPFIGTTIVGAVNVAATWAVLFMMDSYGRKTLILWSSAGMFISCIFIVMSLLGYFNHIVALVAVNSYVAFFEFGLGPIPWLIVAEMFDGKYVAVAMSISSQVNWVCNFIIGFVFPYMNEYLGPYSFAPFACVLLATFVFAATTLPETQGKTPEQLAAQMTRTLSDVVVYKPNEEAVSQIDVEWQKAMEQLQQEEDMDRQRGTYDYGFKPIASS